MNSLLNRREVMMGIPQEPLVPEFYSYLNFDGTAYIATNILLPSNGSLKTYVKLGSTVRRECFFSALNSSSQFVFGIKTTNAYNFVADIYYNSTSSVKNTGGISWANHANSNLWLTPSAYSAADKTGTFTKGSVSPTHGINFGNRGTQGFSGSMATVYIYDDSAQNVTTLAGFNSFTPLYTLKPCEYGGQCGFWCEETNTFYGNSASSGTLTVSN